MDKGYLVQVKYKEDWVSYSPVFETIEIAKKDMSHGLNTHKGDEFRVVKVKVTYEPLEDGENT